MKTVILTLTLLLAAASLLPAQDVPVFAWWDSPLARDINLTDAQREQIRNITREYRERLIQARADVQKAEGLLDDLMNEDTVDLRQAEELTNKLVDARANLMRQITMMSVRLRNVLTREQWQDLQRRRNDRRRIGPGGPLLGPGRRPGPGAANPPAGRGPWPNPHHPPQD